MELTVGTDSWVTLTEADDYLKKRFGASKVWNETLAQDDRVAALATAYRQLNGCGVYSFPDESTQAMKDAQCEMALFILLHQEDADQRAGLIAQGVTQAGIVQESYDSKMAGVLPIPPVVRGLLSGMESAQPVYGVDMKLDDEKEP